MRWALGVIDVMSGLKVLNSVMYEMLLVLVLGPLFLVWLGFILAVDPEEVQFMDPENV